MFSLISCASSNVRNVRRPYPYSPSASEGLSSTKPIVTQAPWEVWELTDYGNPAVKLGNRFVEQGRLSKAIEQYEKGIGLAKSAPDAENAILLYVSSLLKMGKGSDALATITKYAKKKNVDAGQLDAKFSLLTGYAYLQTKDPTQAFAWMSQTYRSGNKTAKVATEARRAGRELARTLSESELQTASTQWKNDSFVSSILMEEKERRLRGGSPLSYSSILEYFSPHKYELTSSPTVVADDLAQNSGASANLASETQRGVGVSTQNLKFGALLPLSGVYASHAENVARGIELALEQSFVSQPLIRVDTTLVSPLVGYQDLVRNQKVDLVFGPLLVKDAEQISSLAASLGVPAITFAKKRGLPESSVALFRLGATAENQLAEAFRFASTVKNLGELTIFLPQDELGAEFKEAAQILNARMSSPVFKIVEYSPENFSSIDSAIQSALLSNPKGLMFVDMPSRLEALLTGVRQQPELASLPAFGSAITADIKQVSNSRGLLDGMYLVSLFNPSSRQYVVSKFIEDYAKRFNEKPDLLAAQSYDAARFTINAFASSPSPSKDSRGALLVLQNSPDYSGVTGLLSVLPTGELKRNVRIVQVQNTNLVEVE